MKITYDTIYDLLAQADRRKSYHHGEAHWRGVAQAGWYLANADPRVDLDVVLAFAVLHDSRRQNEFDDPEHGDRAAARIYDREDRAHVLTRLLNLTQVDVLTVALEMHNGATPLAVHALPRGYRPTVAACLDADRLNLWRVGKKPRKDLLCTEFAQRDATIEWALRLCDSYCPPFNLKARGEDRNLPPLLTWDHLATAYAALETTRATRRFAKGPMTPWESRVGRMTSALRA